MQAEQEGKSKRRRRNTIDRTATIREDDTSLEKEDTFPYLWSGVGMTGGTKEYIKAGLGKVRVVFVISKNIEG